MRISTTEPKDLPIVMNIYDYARTFMRKRLNKSIFF